MRSQIKLLSLCLCISFCLGEVAISSECPISVIHTDMTESMKDFVSGEALVLLSNEPSFSIVAEKLLDILNNKYGKQWISTLGTSINGIQSVINTTILIKHGDKSIYLTRINPDSNNQHCNQNSTADHICNQLQNGNYKTVYLSDGRIRLINGNTSYTFSEGNIKSAHIEEISPFDECFVNNGKTYYIRQNTAVVYTGTEAKSMSWNPTNANIRRVVITRNGQTLGFFVPPVSQSTNSGRAITNSNGIQTVAYGGGSLSTSYFNGNIQVRYDGWNIPFEFNAFLSKSDNSVVFFKANKYSVSVKNTNTNMEWKDVHTLFGC